MIVTYLFDPLCGWCYGASPSLDQIAAIDGVQLELAPTGLFAGEGARPMDKQFAQYAWQNDQRIARLSGQTFSESYRQQVLGEPGALFDSAPATLALVAVGLTDPARERDVLKLLQSARYVDGKNNSDLNIVVDILAEAGFTEAAARIRTPDEPLLAKYRKRTTAARKLMEDFGAQGVPALILGEGGSARLASSSALYGGLDVLIKELEAA
jgi:putative protein-disulfide isomerase